MRWISWGWVAASLAAFGLVRPASAQDTPKPDPVVAELVAAHNKERAEAKLPPLTFEAKLEASAVEHAKDMAEHETMSHEGTDKSTPAERVERAGYVYRKTGENVAWGQPDVATVMKGWMESPHHKENILGDFTEIGVARATAKNGANYWSVSFGKPPLRLDPATAVADLVTLLNQERDKAMRPHFQVDAKLAEKARSIAAEQASKGKEAPAPNFDGIDPRAYKSMGMSLSAGQATPEEVVKTLMESPDHKKNLLGDPTRIGVGYATAAGGNPFWCLITAVSAARK